MECDNVRSQHPNVKFESCCESCHEDEDEGFGHDLWIKIDDRDRHVCCAIMRGFSHRSDGGTDDNLQDTKTND